MAATAVDCKTGKGSTRGSGRKGRAGLSLLRPLALELGTGNYHLASY